MANTLILKSFQGDNGNKAGRQYRWNRCSGGMGQMALRACLVDRLGQLLGQDLAELVNRDVVARRELADGVVAEHGAKLVGRDRQVLAVTEPGFDLIAEARLLEFCDDRAEAALIVAAEHLAQ